MKPLVVITLLLLSGFVFGQRGTFLTAREFQYLAFPNGEPGAGVLWLNAEQKARAAQILGHSFDALRVRYWREGGRTAWVLEEIGKEQPITIGVVVDSGRIVDFVVLAFRESRGGEIRYPFFTRQFQGLSLTADALPPETLTLKAPANEAPTSEAPTSETSTSEASTSEAPKEDALAGPAPALSGTVDGITGATLSVRAAKKVATLALFFHQQVMAVGTGGGSQ